MPISAKVKLKAIVSDFFKTNDNIGLYYAI